MKINQQMIDYSNVILHDSTAFLCWIQNAFFGLFSENLVFAYRIRAFRNILYQDATYFDDPKCVPGKLITRLASDAPNMKAVIV